MKKYFQQDLHQLSTGHKTIHIQVNGSPGVFILDTGATHNIISKKHYHNFNITDLEEKKIGGVGSSNIPGSISSSNEIFLDPIILDDVTFLVMELDHINTVLISNGEKTVNGIIGISTLSRMNSIIDIKNNKIFVK